jgi:DNA mismatch repair protein MutS2
MEIKVGDFVEVQKLRKRGVVLEIRSNGKLKVAVGDLTLECPIDELRHASPPAVLQGPQERSVSSLTRAASKERSKLLEVDLHGLRVKEALAIAEERIDRAILAGVDEMRFIHGIGGGRIKEALHERLSSLSSVREFKVDEMNPGITRVFL